MSIIGTYQIDPAVDKLLQNPDSRTSQRVSGQFVASVGIRKIETMSRSEYDALTDTDDDVLYFVEG